MIILKLLLLGYVKLDPATTTATTPTATPDTTTEQTTQNPPSSDVTPSTDQKKESDPSFFEKYKLYLGVGGVVALIGGYWYMNNGKKEEAPYVNDSMNNKEPLHQENGKEW